MTAMVLLVIALAACGDDDAGAPAADTTEPSAPTAPTAPTEPPATDPPATTMPVRPDRSLPPGRLPEAVPSTSVMSTPASTPVTGEVPAALLDEIVADAVDRTGVAPAAVVAVRAQAVTWPDGSLGCPIPGVVYTQALIAGYWVELDADGTLLDYRVGRNDAFTLCEDPSTIRRP